jgi:hypothetical protein
MIKKIKFLFTLLIFVFSYSDYDSHITPKLLLFYYLLIYETKRRETLITTLQTLSNPSNNPVVGNRLIPPSLDALITYRYPTEIFESIPINYFLLKAKEADFAIIYPSLLRFVINLYTQLCQVDHCLYEPTLDNGFKWKNLDQILNKLRDIKASISENNLTRNEAHMFKKLWFMSYSIHGRK